MMEIRWILTLILGACAIGALSFLTENRYPRARPPATSNGDLVTLAVIVILLVSLWSEP
jgi:hypothetical protein